MDLVASLVAKSLVVVDGVSMGSTRYRLLEPIRQYAARELDDQATEQLRSRFIDYWSATLAASYDPDSRFAWRDHERATALEPDQANLTAAIEWALASGRFDDAMVIFASPFGDLLMLQGPALELGLAGWSTALEHRDAISPGTLVWALEMAARFAAPLRATRHGLAYARLGMRSTHAQRNGSGSN